MGKPHERGGLDWGPGNVALALSAIIVVRRRRRRACANAAVEAPDACFSTVAMPAVTVETRSNSRGPSLRATPTGHGA